MTVTESTPNPFGESTKTITTEQPVLHWNGMTQEAFIKLIRPAFHVDALTDDIEAVLKRTNVIVNSATHLYIRPAGCNDDDNDVEIRRIALNGDLLITKDAKAKLAKFSQTGQMPPLHDLAIAQEQNYIRTFFKKVKELRLGRPATDADMQWKSQAGSIDDHSAPHQNIDDTTLDSDTQLLDVPPLHSDTQETSDQLMDALAALLQQKEILKEQLAISTDEAQTAQLADAFAEVEQTIENHQNEMRPPSVTKCNNPVAAPVGMRSSVACSSGSADPALSIPHDPASTPRATSVSSTPAASPDKKKARTEDLSIEEDFDANPMGLSPTGFGT